METKLDAIKWAIDHIDETFYLWGKEYQIVGVGFNSVEWVAICRSTSGWMSTDYSDCILSDLPNDEFNNFNYINIKRIWEPRKKV